MKALWRRPGLALLVLTAGFVGLVPPAAAALVQGTVTSSPDTFNENKVDSNGRYFAVWDVGTYDVEAGHDYTFEVNSEGGLLNTVTLEIWSAGPGSALVYTQNSTSVATPSGGSVNRATISFTATADASYIVVVRSDQIVSYTLTTQGPPPPP